MSTFFQDIRYGIRMLVKNRGVTLMAILALAIGIGANSSIFSLVNSVMVSSMPFPGMTRQMRVFEVQKENDNGANSISGPNYLEVKEQSQSFDSYTLITVGYFNYSDGQGKPERLPAYMFSSEIFSSFEIPLQIGRGFLPEEIEEGKNHVVVLTNGIWKERFGSNKDIVGKTINLDDVPYTIIGVLPPELGFMEGEAKIWLTLPRERYNKARGDRYYASVARLKEGVTVEQAQAELDAIAQRLGELYPDTNAKYGLHIEPLMDRLVRFMKQTFIVLHGVVGFVLLIACSIVASLLLARASSRQKEIAIRSAMGASRLRIIRQVLTESVLLAVMGGAAGLLIALWGIDAIGSLLPPSLAPFLMRAGLNDQVLLFTVVVSIVTGLLFGLFPALQVSKTNLRDTLNEGGRGSGLRSRGHRTLRFLVVGEIALSLVLLISAGLMVNSFVHLQNVDPGFQSDHLLTCHVFLSDAKYQEPNQKRTFYRDIVQRVSSIPGVEGLAAPSVLPMTWGEGTFYEIEGKPPVSENDRRFAQSRNINPDYFQVMDIPLLKGRYFTHEDEDENTYKVIINERLARDFDGEPVGQLIRLPEWDGKRYEVVGVVGNVKTYGMRSEIEPTVYVSYLHRPTHHVSFVLKTQGNPNRLATALRGQIWAIDPDLPVNNLKTMDDLIGDSMIMERFGMILMSLFSVVALILSSLGIYGIMAYSTSQRTHEIGIRIAIGAQVGDVIKMIVWQGLRLTLIGVILGLAGAYGVSRLLSSQLYGISPTDPLTYINVSLILCGVSLMACYFPARKAAKVDPLNAMRCE